MSIIKRILVRRRIKQVRKQIERTTSEIKELMEALGVDSVANTNGLWTSHLKQTDRQAVTNLMEGKNG